MTAQGKDKSKDQGPVRIKARDAKALQKEIAELNERLVELQQSKGEVFAQLQRVSADYANFQRRVPKQISDSVSYEKERVIRSMLPAMDNFEHMLANAASAESVEVVVKGVEMIYSQMLDMLRGHGVELITAMGEKFDPSMHEAMMRRADAEQEDGVVLEEFQKGYRLNGRVIRPSKVIVNKVEAIQAAGEQADVEGDDGQGQELPGDDSADAASDTE